MRQTFILLALMVLQYSSNAQTYKHTSQTYIGNIPAGVLDTQSFTAYFIFKKDILDYRFRSGCGCVSMAWDSSVSEDFSYPKIKFIYNSSGNKGEISRYGIVYFYKKDKSIDSLKISITASVFETQLDKMSLVKQLDTAIHFTTTLCDFDTIQEGEQVQARFIFKNNGSVPIAIYSHESSCGCCYPTYSKDPIQPGQTGEVIVHFNSNGKVGHNIKTVAVIFSSGQRVELKIKAIVAPKTIKDQ